LTKIKEDRRAAPILILGGILIVTLPKYAKAQKEQTVILITTK
jgi:hypothetical protein